jgi:hypothetical protein
VLNQYKTDENYPVFLYDILSSPPNNDSALAQQAAIEFKLWCVAYKVNLLFFLKKMRL